MPKLFKTDIESEADLKVYVTEIRSEADLVVYETENHWDAAGSQKIWSYTETKLEADRVVYFTESPWDAHLKIYLTEISTEAGWLNSTKDDLI